MTDALEELQEQVNRLKKHVNEFQEKLDAYKNENKCRACGSRLRRTVYEYRCMQEHGPCGELVMSDQLGRESNGAFFTKTRYTLDTLEPRTHDLAWKPFLRLYFIAGEQLAKEDYLYRITAE